MGLRALLRAHPEEIEADLLSEYGVDVADVHRGRVSWRRFRVLVQQLPEASRLKRALLSPDEREQASWGVTDHLLATVVDQLAWANYATRRTAGDKSAQVPGPTWRPGSTPAKPKGIRFAAGEGSSSPHEMADFFGIPVPS